MRIDFVNQVGLHLLYFLIGKVTGQTNYFFAAEHTFFAGYRQYALNSRIRPLIKLTG